MVCRSSSKVYWIFPEEIKSLLESMNGPSYKVEKMVTKILSYHISWKLWEIIYL